MTINKIIKLKLILLLTLFLFSCNNDDSINDDTNFIAEDWTTESHSKDINPNFNEVFVDNTVKRFDFKITAEHWQQMLDDMTKKLGVLGSGGNEVIEMKDPIYVPGEVFYNGKQWYRVGIRFKGNSSLQLSWKNGILKLPFKLDFDEFEDDYPQIKNQRFYGFKKFSLKNNFGDNSFIREKITGDLFRKGEMVGSHTAFYTLYVDFGKGPTYFGLYTLVEEVNDTVIKTQFSDDDGNLYKPEGNGASFKDGSFGKDFFVKKSNKSEGDWSDIQKLFNVLHSNKRLTDVTSWRNDLDNVFDTNTFLKFLAFNTAIQNWDTYGRMPHNYYLYNNPETNKLTWINWDNNESLKLGGNFGLPQALAIDFSDLSSISEWPLIGYLYEDEKYKSLYDNYLADFINNGFAIDTMQSLYESYSTLIAPYATTEIEGFSFLGVNSTEKFQNAINELKGHIVDRNRVINQYLNK